MKILVACEYSGIVRDAFAARGHDTWSCDLLPTESPGAHYCGDINAFLDIDSDWDIIVAHPDCTKMAVCGNGTWANTPERLEAQAWTRKLWDRCCKIARKGVCFENPVSTLSKVMPVKAQYIHPWQFGHPETKKTGLWLHNLEPLEETNNVWLEMMELPPKERHKVWYASPGPNRGKDRSRFFPGIAKAMAEKWG